jgi:hypothetical protein
MAIKKYRQYNTERRHWPAYQVCFNFSDKYPLTNCHRIPNMALRALALGLVYSRGQCFRSFISYTGRSLSCTHMTEGRYFSNQEAVESLGLLIKRNNWIGPVHAFAVRCRTVAMEAVH